MEGYAEVIEAAVFYLVAAVIVISGLGVVISKNIVHSALLLVLAFLGIAACFFELQAGFLALMQILIYGGAVSVLLVFAIMLVMQERTEATNPPIGSRVAGGISLLLGLALLGGLGAAIAYSGLPAGGLNAASGAPVDTVAALAQMMLGDYVLAFELAAILLLVAVAGAIVLARGEDGAC